MSTETATKAPKRRPRRGKPRPGAPTPMQKRAVALFREQILKGGTLTVEEILLKAGYDKNTARQQTNIMAGIRPLLQPFIERMEKLRERAIGRMEKTVGRASFADANTAVDKLTKNIQLLSGKPTSTLSLSDEDLERIDELING